MGLLEKRAEEQFGEEQLLESGESENINIDCSADYDEENLYYND